MNRNLIVKISIIKYDRVENVEFISGVKWKKSRKKSRLSLFRQYEKIHYLETEKAYN